MIKYSQFLLERKETQLEKGIKIESEHLDIYEKINEYLVKNNIDMPWSKQDFYKMIAEAHLNELPDYYDRLEKIEK